MFLLHNLLVKKMERERMEKLRKKAEKEKAEKEKESADKVWNFIFQFCTLLELLVLIFGAFAAWVFSAVLVIINSDTFHVLSFIT